MKAANRLIFWGVMFFAQRLIAGECIYTAPSPGNPQPEPSPQGECGTFMDDDHFKMYQKHLDRLVFGVDGLAAVFVDGKAFCVSKDGRSARVHYFDNGADYFVEGRARTISKGKYGFIDRKLNVVIKPEYDFVLPFERGLAAVCNGCRFASDGEHSLVCSGAWGAINLKGEIVYPVVFTKEELFQKLIRTRSETGSADEKSRAAE